MWPTWDKTKEWHVTDIVTFNSCDYFALKETMYLLLILQSDYLYPKEQKYKVH